MATASHLVQVLGGSRVLKAVKTAEDLRERLRQGLPYDSFEALRSAFRLNAKELVTALAVPERTLARRRVQKRFRPEESDRLFRLARILATAEDVLGGRDRATGWLREPNRALGGETPLRRIDTDLGTGEVENLLGRIAHGVYS